MRRLPCASWGRLRRMLRRTAGGSCILNRRRRAGLIDTSYGGTSAEAWMSRSALESEPQFKTVFEQFDQRLTKYHRDVLAYEEAAVKARAAGTPLPVKPSIFAGPESPQRPMGL